MAGFLGADDAVVARVEEENDDVLLPQIGGRHARAVVEGEGGVGGVVARLDRGHFVFVPAGRHEKSPAFQRWVKGRNEIL